jgi:glycosyltransferase involved in cell wall biosynthesis
MTTALIILTFNEIDGVKELLPRIDRNWVDEILVVDGGSTDGTIQECKKMGFDVIVQEIKGHGGAILTGVKKTKAGNIIIFGPDGNHEINEIKILKDKIKEGFDQVIINRFGKNSINLDAGIIDGFGNKMFTQIANLFFKGNLSDMLNESRIITRKAFDEIEFDAMQLDSTYQMSIRGLKMKQRIFEIEGNEGRRIGGQRKMKRIQTGFRLLKRLIIEIYHNS